VVIWRVGLTEGEVKLPADPAFRDSLELRKAVRRQTRHARPGTARRDRRIIIGIGPQSDFTIERRDQGHERFRRQADHTRLSNLSRNLAGQTVFEIMHSEMNKALGPGFETHMRQNRDRGVGLDRAGHQFHFG
jgi:hypothetical protein